MTRDEVVAVVFAIVVVLGITMAAAALASSAAEFAAISMAGILAFVGGIVVAFKVHGAA